MTWNNFCLIVDLSDVLIHHRNHAIDVPTRSKVEERIGFIEERITNIIDVGFDKPNGDIRISVCRADLLCASIVYPHICTVMDSGKLNTGHAA